jgi:hypothetical protein
MPPLSPGEGEEESGRRSVGKVLVKKRSRQKMLSPAKNGPTRHRNSDPLIGFGVRQDHRSSDPLLDR